MEKDLAQDRHELGPRDLPDDYGDEAVEHGEDNPKPSLTDDVMALLDDGKTYVQAELAYQKSRAAFASNRIKYAAAYGAAAFGVLHLALIAIAVGLVIALAPIVTIWGAIAIVGGLLIVAGIVFLRSLKRMIDEIREAFGSGDES